MFPNDSTVPSDLILRNVLREPHAVVLSVQQHRLSFKVVRACLAPWNCTLHATHAGRLLPFKLVLYVHNTFWDPRELKGSSYTRVARQ